MKIGINLVGVSYNDGKVGRYRNYEDAIKGLYQNIIDPLQEQNHKINFYLYTYDNVKKEQIKSSYTPLIKSTFIDSQFNILGGGDKHDTIKIMSLLYINSLKQLKNEDLDLIISTRFDINFFKNPFKEYNFDYNKFNFLWREPEYTHLPIVNDTFVVFPYSMLEQVIDSIIEMETNPPFGVNIGMHNWYLPLCNQIGNDQIKWVEEDFKTTLNNDLYKLMRHE